MKQLEQVRCRIENHRRETTIPFLSKRHSYLPWANQKKAIAQLECAMEKSPKIA